jgi:hypothetical protein
MASRAITEQGWLSCLEVDFVLAASNAFLFGNRNLRQQADKSQSSSSSTTKHRVSTTLSSLSTLVPSSLAAVGAMFDALGGAGVKKGGGSGDDPSAAAVRVKLVHVYLVVPLLVGHAYALFCNEFSVVDTLVLLFIGALLFPFLPVSSSQSAASLSTAASPVGIFGLGPLAFKILGAR